MSSYIHQHACTIALNGDTSAAVFIGGEFTLVAIEYPSAWDAAAITFQVSFDGITYYDLLDDGGTEVTLTVTAAQFREVESSQFKSAIWLKVRSGPSAAPVTQTSARALTLWTRRYIAR